MQSTGIEHGWMGTLPTSQAAVVCSDFRTPCQLLAMIMNFHKVFGRPLNKSTPGKIILLPTGFCIHYNTSKNAVPELHICAKTASLPFLKFVKGKNCQFIYSCCIRSCHLLSSCQMPMPLIIDMSQGFVYKLSLPPDVKST